MCISSVLFSYQTYPLRTLEAGYAAGRARSRDVLMAQGSYTLLSPLVLAEDVSIYGGYSGKPEWARKQVDSYITHILSASTTAIIAENILKPTKLEWSLSVLFPSSCDRKR